ncbi:Uncharacterized protein YbcI [Geosporobacter subterraneus DSM 17957]|uniref:Uncharacterized protein YbcI n=1 Tax=Geosporobacter subterraneus DSM 17957 TaxID=1121919 RepID=A0A1M6ETT8_9FIRM|nr:Na-translocating system protein MpsC family protein [Geosporobacter subterraneus]SHI88780.1 Uncharacterized protein YbcI [Geosporobacter subterraneus DSM 17957]
MPIHGKITKAKRIQNEQQMAIIVAKLLRETTGKGPRNVRAKILEDVVEISIEGFLTDLEQFLIAADNIVLVEQIRECIGERIHKEIERKLSEVTAMELQVLHVQRRLIQDCCRITLIITS